MLNESQKKILEASARIDSHSDGGIRLTYHKAGCSIAWTLYVDGIPECKMNTAQARAFVKGYQLALRGGGK